MPLDIERNVDIANVSVSFSRTIELICALRYLASKQSTGFTEKEAGALYSSLGKESQDTIAFISRMRLKGLELQEFVLREKIFDDVELLLKRIKSYEQANFIFTFIGEELPLETVQELCGDPEGLQELLRDKEKSLSNDTGILEQLFYQTDAFRNRVLELLRDMNNKQFDNIIKNQAVYYSRLANEVKEKLAGKHPLDFSQEFYGKKFRRIYDFRDYLFIPSYFMKPGKMRFFNFNTQIIIFSSDEESMKKLETGDRVSGMLKIVSDRTRLEILRELSSGPAYGKTLAEKLGLTGSTISHHMDQLKELGLVTEERNKNIKYFTVNKREVEAALKEFKEYLTGK